MAQESRNVAPQVLIGRKIVFILGALELGGAERQAIILANYLRTQVGAHVEVWGLLRSGRAADLCDELGVPWRLFPLPPGPSYRGWWLRAAWKLARKLRKEGAEVLLPYLAMPNILCGLGWRFSGAGTCIWNQRDLGHCLDSRIVPWAVRNTPAFVSNSHVGADYLADRFGLARNRIHVAHNAISLPPPLAGRDDWRARLALDAECFVACMVANVSRTKDHATLLRAWRIVLDSFRPDIPPPVLLLAGRLDHAEQSVKALAYDLELGNSVRFLGAIDDIAGLLSAVDLGVHSSQSEGCPNGVLECMAAGLPVVATDIPGIREAVGDDNRPWLARSGDAQAFAEQVTRLRQDPAQRRAIGCANKERVASNFSMPRLGLQMTQIIQECSTSEREKHGGPK